MKNKLFIKIGKKIKEFRKDLNLTQEELAHRAGIHPTFLAHIERGKKIASVNTLNKIAKSLKIYYLKKKKQRIFTL